MADFDVYSILGDVVAYLLQAVFFLGFPDVLLRCLHLAHISKNIITLKSSQCYQVSAAHLLRA